MLGEQIRYLQLRVAGCRARPELHRHQIEAYDHLLALAGSCDDLASYHAAMQRAGAILAVVRAEWLDRYCNARAIYRSLSDARRSSAAEICYRAAVSAGDDDFLSAVVRAKRQASPIQIAADTGRGALVRILVAVMEWATEASPGVAADKLDEIRAFWSVLQRSDPDCTWGRVCRDPGYRQCIPFDGEQLQAIAAWLRRVLGPALDTPAGQGENGLADLAVGPDDSSEPEEPGAPSHERGRASPGVTHEREPLAPLPSVEQVAAPYRAVHSALDQGDPELRDVRAVYQSVFAIEARAGDAPTFLRMLAEEDIFCRLAREPQLAVARSALAHAAELSQPHAEYHYRELLAALERSRTPTEIEYELERANACHAVETAWHEIALRYGLKAISAAIAFSSEPSEVRRQTVVASDRLVREFFGQSWDQQLRNPRIWDFFSRVIFARGQHVLAFDHGADHVALGEVGVSTIEVAREATLWRLIEEAQNDNAGTLDHLHERITRLPRELPFSTPEDMGEYLSERFRRATGESERSVELAPIPLVLWGRRISVADWMQAASAPPRPAIARD